MKTVTPLENPAMKTPVSERHLKLWHGSSVLFGLSVIAILFAAGMWHIAENLFHEYLAAMLSIVAAIFLTGAIGVDAIERIK